MRITVVKDDAAVSVDGKGFGGLDLSFLPDGIHAIQWSGAQGEIEWRDPETKKAVANEPITTLPYQDQIMAAWQAALAAEPLPPPPLPPPEKTFSSLEFLDLFTESEQLSIAQLALQSPQAKLWYDRMLAANYIVASDPRTAAGLDFLIAQGLISPERRAEILGVML